MSKHFKRVLVGMVWWLIVFAVWCVATLDPVLFVALGCMVVMIPAFYLMGFIMEVAERLLTKMGVD